MNGNNWYRLARRGADDFRDVNRTKRTFSSLDSQPMQRWRLSHGRRAVCRGPRGRPPSPWLGRRPRRERQAVTELLLARRHGRGGGANPQPCRSPTTVAEPGPVTRWRTFRGDRCHDRTKMAPVAATCRHCHVTLIPSRRATTHRSIPWHAPGARLPGLVRRICCRPGHERSSRPASSVGRRRRCWT
jgi:hypothetical protein